MEISELVAKREQLQYELNIENQRGGLKDAAKVERLEAQIAELTVELEKPEVDPVIERAEEEIELFGVPLGAYFSTIADHVAVRSVIIPAFRQLKQEIFDVENSSQREIKELKEDAFELNDTISQLHEEITKLKSELYESQLLAADNAKKRDNASDELLEAKKTIDELNDKISAATTPPKTSTRTNLDGAEEVKKVKRTIYNVEYIGRHNEKFKAKFADTDESFEDYSFYKDAKYTEVQAEEAATFRTEFLAKQEQERNHEDMAQHNSVEDKSVTVPVPAFREDGDSTTSGLDQTYASSEVAGSEVSREEFEALKSTVKLLESAVFTVREVA